MSKREEPPHVKALEILAEMDPVEEWPFSQRLVVTSLAISALQMLEQHKDQEEHDARD